MGSSLVKPSRREILRRGPNAASASRRDAQVNKGTNDGQKDERCKVDTLTVPISNYCKPVSVVSQNGNIKGSCLQEGNHRSRSIFKSERGQTSIRFITNTQSEFKVEEEEYISPVLRKEFGQENTQLNLDLNPDLPNISSPRPLQGNNSVPPPGSGDSSSSTHGLPPISNGKLNLSSRRKRFFSGSCVGRRNNKTLDSEKDSSDSHEKLSKKNESKSKEIATPVQVLEPEHDDQDVSRDARIPSPEYNDFENVIVTEPTSLKTRTFVSSPVDCYVYTKDVETKDETPSEGISIKKSNNPAPLHRGERRCELNIYLPPDLSSSTLNSENVETHADIHGDSQATCAIGVSSKTNVPTDRGEVTHSFQEQGDSTFDRKDKIIEYENKTINVCSTKDKQLNYGYEDESALHISDIHGVDANVHSKSGVPKTNHPILISVQPIKEYSRIEEQITPCETKLQPNFYKEAVSNVSATSKVLETAIGDYMTESKRDNQEIEQKVYICGAVNFESSPVAGKRGLQECASGATKCLCDVNQFDFDNGDDINKSKSINISTEATDPLNFGPEGEKTTKATGDLTEVGARRVLKTEENKREQGLECLEFLPDRGTNRSEPNMISLTRRSRFNCLRPDDKECAEAISDRDKPVQGEYRPSSWSHISSGYQAESRHAITRPYSAITGSNNTSVNEDAIGKPIDSSFERANSPSQSNLSLSGRQDSHIATNNGINCGVEKMNDKGSIDKCTLYSYRETTPLHMSSKTSLVDQNESLKTNSTHDMERLHSAQSLTSSGRLQRSRPTSAQSSRRSIVDQTGQMCHHSQGQVSAHNSRHNLSRSLSNHSSAYNDTHSPWRPPSVDSNKHSPRPPSAHSGEGGLRKIRSRPSLVHVSGSATSSAKQPSNHSIALEPLKTPSYQKLEVQSYSLPAISGDRENGHGLSLSSVSTSLNFENQVKLPPIKAASTISWGDSRPVTEPWTSPGQPVRLPPVITTRPGGAETSSEQPVKTANLDFYWGSVLPPVGGAEEKANVVGKPSAPDDRGQTSDSTKCGTYGDSAMRECDQILQQHSYRRSSFKDDQDTTETVAGNAHFSPPLLETAENSGRGDPNPSPTDSHTHLSGTHESLYTASKTDTSDISRLLATYLPHKYSATEAARSAPAEDCPTSRSPGMLEEKTTFGAVDCKEKRSPDHTVPEMVDKKMDYTKYISNVSKEEYSNEEKDMSHKLSSYALGDCSKTLTSSLYERQDEQEEKNYGTSANPSFQNGEEIKEVTRDVKTNEASTDWKKSSLVMKDYKSLLEKYSTSAKEDEDKEGEVESVSEEKTEMDETLKNLSEAGSELRSTLEKFATDALDKNVGNESSKPVNDDNKEDDLTGPCTKPLSEDTTGFSYENRAGYQKPEMITEDNPQNCPADDFNKEERSKFLTQSNDQSRLSSHIVTDYVALMAKYPCSSEEKKLNIEETTDARNKADAVISSEITNFVVESNALSCGFTDLDKDSTKKVNGVDDMDAHIEGGNYDDKPKEKISGIDDCQVVKSTKEGTNSLEQTTEFDITSILAKYSSRNIDNLADSGKNLSDSGDNTLSMHCSKTFGDSPPIYAGNECLEDNRSYCKSTNSSVRCEQPEEKSLDLSENPAIKNSLIENTRTEETTEIHKLDKVYDADLGITSHIPDMTERIEQFDGELSNTAGPTEHVGVTADSEVKDESTVSPTPCAVTHVLTMKTDEDLPAGNYLSSPRMSESDLVHGIQPVAGDTHADNTIHNQADETNVLTDTAEDTVAIKECLSNFIDKVNATNVDMRNLSPNECKQGDDEAKPDTREETSESNQNLFNARQETNDLSKHFAPLTEKTLDSSTAYLDAESTPQVQKAETQDLSQDNNTFSVRQETSSPTHKDDQDLAMAKKSPTNLCTLNENIMQTDAEIKHEAPSVKVEICETEKDFGSSNTLHHCHAEETLSLPLNEESKNNACEITYETNEENHVGEDQDGVDDFQLHTEDNHLDLVDSTCQESSANAALPHQSSSQTKEESVDLPVPELLSSDRIDTIRKQIYEEGLKPCQRDGGVAFFIPVSNTGLQPPVNNTDIGDRLAKPKKPSMSYEERMMMADINRHNHLSKKKEFAVKDLINVKSATTSNSSASGENISGAGQQDRSDNKSDGSDSGSLH